MKSLIFNSKNLFCIEKVTKNFNLNRNKIYYYILLWFNLSLWICLTSSAKSDSLYPSDKLNLHPLIIIFSAHLRINLIFNVILFQGVYYNVLIKWYHKIVYGLNRILQNHYFIIQIAISWDDTVPTNFIEFI